MGCGCMGMIVFFFSARVLLVVFWIIGYAKGEPSMLWNVLGFLFMPATLCAWIFTNVTHGGEFTGWYLVLLVFAIAFDLGGQGGSSSSASTSRRRRQRRQMED